MQYVEEIMIEPIIIKQLSRSKVEFQEEWNKFIKILGYKYWNETNNLTYKLFLGASD